MITFAGMKLARFTKMHGIGNDYIYFTEYPCHPDRLPELARTLSDRHCGIGGDGIILALPSEIADFKMRIFNADGSEAKMCGNGSRCVGKLLRDSGLTTKDEITLETAAGIKTLRFHYGSDSKVDMVSVDMGKVTVFPAAQRSTSAGLLSINPVDMGNPHGVVFIDTDPDEFDVHGIGATLEHDHLWIDRANIEFAQILSRQSIKVRVWERGSGETMACGTGACAVAAAAFKLGLCDSKCSIHLPGGTLQIEINPSDEHVTMTGPAVTVFEGMVNIYD